MVKPKRFSELQRVDTKDLAAFVRSLSHVEWSEWAVRQNTYKAHATTLSYPILWTDQTSFAEGLEITRVRSERLVHRVVEPYVLDLQRHFAGTAVKAMLVNLLPNSEIGVHVDLDCDVLSKTHRCHLPIQTNEGVEFFLEDGWFHLKEAHWYEIDNRSRHGVKNASQYERIHLIVDIVPSRLGVKISYRNR